jgi:hypothetical protein
MTIRYSHLADACLRAAVNQVNLDTGGSENGTHLAPMTEGEQPQAAKYSISLASPTGFEPVLPT